MTATSRKPQSGWRTQIEDEDSDAEAGNKEVNAASKESQREWDVIAREVREERRKVLAETKFAAGNSEGVVAYADVASDAEDEPAPIAKPRRGSPGRAEAAESKAGSDGEDSDDKESLPPGEVVTAGKNGHLKQRGGLKTGGQRKKRLREAQEKEDEETGKWLKLRLEGEAKSRRIKAARIVYYHDHDAGGSGGAKAACENADVHAEDSIAQAASAQAAGNFRSQVTADIWGDDDSDD